MSQSPQVVLSTQTKILPVIDLEPVAFREPGIEFDTDEITPKSYITGTVRTLQIQETVDFTEGSGINIPRPLMFEIELDRLDKPKSVTGKDMYTIAQMKEILQAWGIRAPSVTKGILAEMVREEYLLRHPEKQGEL